MKPSIDVETGKYLDSPFDWPHLNLSTDMGPDMISMLFFFDVLVGLKPVDRFRPPHQHLHDLTLPYYSYPILFSSPHYPTVLPHRFLFAPLFFCFLPAPHLSPTLIYLVLSPPLPHLISLRFSALICHLLPSLHSCSMSMPPCPPL